MSPAQPSSFEQPPISGMDYSLDGIVSDPSKMWFLENMMVYEGKLVYRPAITGTVDITSGTKQLLVAGLTGFAASYYVISGGQIYDSGGSVVVSTANFATASITISTTAECFAVGLNGKLVISDGTNTPFQWDGTSGAGGLTSLTACPVLYGQPVVYYAKLTGIKNSDRQVFVWSEENDPTIGYEAGGYSNAWRLTQTSQNQLTALGATNAALYYFRSTSIGVISGAIAADFATTGVHDSVSIDTGSARGQVLVTGNRIWFYDAYDRPNMLEGSTITELWRQAKHIFNVALAGTTTLPPYLGDASANAFGSLIVDTTTASEVYQRVHVVDDLDAVIFWYSGPSTMSRGLLFNLSALRFMGVWTIPTAAGPSANSRLVGAIGNAVLGFGGTIAFIGGFEPLERSDVGGDDLGGTATNPTSRCITGQYLRDGRLTKHFDTITVECLRRSPSGTSQISSFGIQYLTSDVDTISGMAAAATVTPTVDQMENTMVGIAGYGRWIAVALTVNHTGTVTRSKFEIGGVRVDSFADAMADATA